MKKIFVSILVCVLLTCLAGCDGAPPTSELVKIEYERNNSMAYSDRFTLDRENGEAMYEYIETGGDILPNNPTYGSESFDISETEWAEVAAFIEACNVPGWREEYNNAFVMDGTIWKVNLEYADGTVKSSKGRNKYPAEYERFSDGFDALFGTDTIAASTGDSPEGGLPQESAPPQDGPFEMGNTPGNNANPIDAVVYEGEAYVSPRGQGRGNAMLLGQDGATLSDLPGARQALDGWLYYVADGGIKRMRPDGGEAETVLEAGYTVMDWCVAGGYLYVLEDYTEGEAYMPACGLWRRPLEGGPVTNYNGNIQVFALSEEHIFTTTRTEGGLFVNALNGGESADGDWLEELYANNFFWLDGWLYYSTETEEWGGQEWGWWGSVWRCREDGSESEMLAEAATGGFNVEDGWLYYNRQLQPQSGDVAHPPGVLERKNLSTGEVQVLDETERARGGIALAGDWVVFQAGAGEGETDGQTYPRRLWYVPKAGGQVLEIREG
ncbi:MAG TPA: hypothetical protein DEB31_00105 [Clostridiales bacterium]|nr:hypothetical protein [Clostridiales bacterium]